VVGRLHVDRRLVVESVEVAPALREEDAVDALAGVALGLLYRGLGAVARLLEIGDGTLDHAAGLALAAADDGHLAPGILSDEGRDLGGADLNGADESVLGFQFREGADENSGKRRHRGGPARERI